MKVKTDKIMKTHAQNLGKCGITDIIFPFCPFLLFLSSLSSSSPCSIFLVVPFCVFVDLRFSHQIQT